MARHSDAFISLPGGYDTLDELLEVISWTQLSIHDKSVGLLNVDGYYNSLSSFIDKVVEEDFISPNACQIIVSAPIAIELIEKLEEYVPCHERVSSKLNWETEQQLGYPQAQEIARAVAPSTSFLLSDKASAPASSSQSQSTADMPSFVDDKLLADLIKVNVEGTVKVTQAVLPGMVQRKRGLDMVCDLLDFSIYVSTLISDSVIVDRIYRSCSVMFMGYQTWVDFVILDIVDFDIILVMSWLSLYHAILDSHAKTRLIGRGCLAFLAHLRDTSVEVSSIESISVVCEFQEVFPEDLPSMSLGHNIDIYIDLEPGSARYLVVRKLRTKEIASVNVQWKNCPIEEATWETEVDVRSTLAMEPEDTTSQTMDHNNFNAICDNFNDHCENIKQALEKIRQLISTCRPPNQCNEGMNQGKSFKKLPLMSAFKRSKLECCDVASSSQVDVVVGLTKGELHESSLCDALDISRLQEDPILVVSKLALVDPIDDKIDSSRKNDLCPPNASTCNMNKYPLPSNKSIYTLVYPCENQGESTLVCELPTTSEGVQNGQSGEDDLDFLECLGNSNYDCTCTNGFDCDPFAVRGGLNLCADCFLRREGDICLEIPSSSFLCVSHVEHTKGDKFETSEYLHKDTIVEVDLCDTFLYLLLVHNVTNDSIEGMPNFGDGTIGEIGYS
ncbi:hypothetical protein T459_23479 [Capsicum annuum]|uniref:cytokinin riboside 5'-monophosphate phosphoribohydrolase n=1 Tax=Capsicum annuum TaxID=4072 RepID=A0A2G2YSP0_CAPAN|nr:hypothetical protein T459_23479 [Capsicum annuum]